MRAPSIALLLGLALGAGAPALADDVTVGVTVDVRSCYRTAWIEYYG